MGRNYLNKIQSCLFCKCSKETDATARVCLKLIGQDKKSLAWVHIRQLISKLLDADRSLEAITGLMHDSQICCIRNKAMQMRPPRGGRTRMEKGPYGLYLN